jgi:sulfate/thiosulfate transport system permease protein
VASRRLLRAVALGYLAALLLVPVALIGYRTFAHGVAPVWDALSSGPARHAVVLSLLVTVIAVPLNVAFGVVAGIAIARRRMPAGRLVNLLVNLPFAMSPVVIGLALFALYGRGGWLGDWLSARGIQVLFSVPGLVLATTFVSLPFVVREVVPVLEEIGTDHEQAAATLGAGPWTTFRRVTLPALRWALAYGVVLSAARALGEYGAASIVSGNIVGHTQTLPLMVEERFRNFDAVGAYSAGFALALMSLLIVAAMTLLSRRTTSKTRGEHP